MNKAEERAYRLGKWFLRLPLWFRCAMVGAAILLILLNVHYSYLLSIPFLWLLWYLFIRVNDKEWQESYPQLEEYWNRYPQTRTDSGTRCYYCGSNRIDSYLWRRHRGRRVHYCHQCRKDLYRTSD